MPANLTPEYEKADLRYRQAGSDEERITALQDMLAAIPKHKGTEKMQADLKRRLSQLRKAGQKSSASKGPDPFHIPKTGAGQVVLAGPPNSGKAVSWRPTPTPRSKSPITPSPPPCRNPASGIGTTFQSNWWTPRPSRPHTCPRG
jgi:hypothetical protein